MRMLWQGPSRPLAWWWALLTLASAGNVSLWILLYHQFYVVPTSALGSAADVELMLFLCAAYVFGCAFRSVLPRADVQRILPVRYLVIERCHRPIGSNRRRDLVRSPVGNRPAPARHYRGSGHHRNCGVGNRAADRRCAVLLVVWSVDDQLPSQCRRELDMGHRLPHSWNSPLPAPTRVRGHRSLGPYRRNLRNCSVLGFSYNDRRPNVPQPVARRHCRWARNPKSDPGSP